MNKAKPHPDQAGRGSDLGSSHTFPSIGYIAIAKVKARETIDISGPENCHSNIESTDSTITEITSFILPSTP